MKRLVLALLLFSAVSQLNAQVVPRFEAGALLGEPIGLSVKWWQSTRSSIDVGAAWSFTDDGLFQVFGDYLFTLFYPNIGLGELPIYAGLGISGRFGDDSHLGFRIPVGVQYVFEGFPLSVFAELAPLGEVLPDTDWNLMGGLGIRLTFGSTGGE